MTASLNKRHRLAPALVLMVLGVVSLVVLISSYASRNTAPVHEQQPITLHGRVYEEKHFGPPNYGENPATDTVEIATIFGLSEPLKIDEPGEKIVIINEVHLIDDEKVDVGKDITLTGRLSAAETGHHRRPYIFVTEPGILERLTHP